MDTEALKGFEIRLDTSTPDESLPQIAIANKQRLSPSMTGRHATNQALADSHDAPDSPEKNRDFQPAKDY